MKSPLLSLHTGYVTSSSCNTHSLTPSLDAFSSGKDRREKGMVGNALLTSLKKVRLALFFREYFFSTALLYTVVRRPDSFGLPSPLDMATSIAYTSKLSKVHGSI